MAIIIGDIHGNVAKVEAFLSYKPEAVHVALGDYVDSFLESPSRQIQALRLLLDSNAVLLWGNHDLHYLAQPPFICTGFQYGREKQYQDMIEAHKRRFLAAYAVDGWLCTHAGVCQGLTKGDLDVTIIVDRLNAKLAAFIEQPHEPGPLSIFAIGAGRGGDSRCGGIFWYDFKRENALDSSIKQIFGHTETKEPVVAATYVALDTTNCADTCYLFDTETNEIVKLKLPQRKIRVDIDFGDDDIIVAENITQEMIEEQRAELQHDIGQAEAALDRCVRGEEDATNLDDLIRNNELNFRTC